MSSHFTVQQAGIDHNASPNRCEPTFLRTRERGGEHRKNMQVLWIQLISTTNLNNTNSSLIQFKVDLCSLESRGGVTLGLESLGTRPEREMYFAKRPALLHGWGGKGETHALVIIGYMVRLKTTKDLHHLSSQRQEHMGDTRNKRSL